MTLRLANISFSFSVNSIWRTIRIFWRRYPCGLNQMVFFSFTIFVIKHLLTTLRYYLIFCLLLLFFCICLYIYGWDCEMIYIKLYRMWMKMIGLLGISSVEVLCLLQTYFSTFRWVSDCLDHLLFFVSSLFFSPSFVIYVFWWFIWSHYYSFYLLRKFVNEKC